MNALTPEQRPVLQYSGYGFYLPNTPLTLIFGLLKLFGICKAI